MMCLEFATTYDMLDELRRREIHFVYAGIPNTNAEENEICYACQGHSRGEMLQLIRMLYDRIETEADLDTAD